jgi:hypothetical protein
MGRSSEKSAASPAISPLKMMLPNGPENSRGKTLTKNVVSIRTAVVFRTDVFIKEAFWGKKCET